MFDFLTKTCVLAAKDPGDIINKLSDILPIIIFGVIWLIAAIAKMVQGAKKDQQGGQKPPEVKRQPDFDDMLKTIRERYTAASDQVRKAAEQQAARIEPPARIPQKTVTAAYRPAAPKPQSVVKPVPVKTPNTSNVAAPESGVKESITKDSQSSFQEYKESERTIPVIHHPYLEGIADDLTHTDGLRKAILYCEIFGTPVGLRD